MSMRAKELGPKGLAYRSWGKSMVIPLYDPPLYDGELLRSIYKILSPDRNITYTDYRE